jgi:hypothetical protein
MPAKTVDWDYETHYARKVAPLLAEAPWVLRVTDRKGKPSPVLILQQRRTVPVQPSGNGRAQKSRKKKAAQPNLFGGAPTEEVILQDRGLLYGESQRRVLPVLRTIVSRVQDDRHVGLELQRLLPLERIEFRGNLPLDDESGCKLTLIFKLQERVKELDRVELIARRVERFTREEAAYWVSRISNFGDDANRWAISGMKIVLGGQAKDNGVERMLEELRSSK